MLLFKELGSPAVLPKARPRFRSAQPQRFAPAAQQLAFAFYLRTIGDTSEPQIQRAPQDLDTDLADDDWDHPQHLWIKASEAMPQQVRAPASVFDLAFKPVRVRMPGHDSAAPVTRVEREGGLVRLTRIQVQDTEAWQERERARRARQKPPKPVKKARTRGRKLLDLIGEGE